MIGIIGRLDSRITLQQPANTLDDQGSALTEWADLATAWAGREEISGAEALAGTSRVATADCKFTMRFQSAFRNLTLTARIQWRGVYFEIVRIDADNASRPSLLTLTARRNSDTVAVTGITGTPIVWPSDNALWLWPSDDAEAAWRN